MLDFKLLMATVEYLIFQFNCSNNWGFILNTLALMMRRRTSLDLHLDFLYCQPFARLRG